MLQSEPQGRVGVGPTRIPGIPTGIGRTLPGEAGPSFAKVHRRSLRGGDYARTTASAAAKFSGWHSEGEVPGCNGIAYGRPLPTPQQERSLSFSRRKQAKFGAPKAIPAAAHKPARVVFHLVTTRQEFYDSWFAAD